MGKKVIQFLRSVEYDTLIRLLTKFRDKRDLTQSEVARRLGMKQPVYWAIENGSRRVDMIELMDICSVLEISIEVLLKEPKLRHPESWK
jgi:transcriptional regulator with XRE-family HTH domain